MAFILAGRGREIWKGASHKFSVCPQGGSAGFYTTTGNIMHAVLEISFYLQYVSLNNFIIQNI